VPTSGLTKSFGWTGAEVFQQQDVQEMFHVLFDALERSAAESKLGEAVATMYRGRVGDYIHCQVLSCFVSPPRAGWPSLVARLSTHEWCGLFVCLYARRTATSSASARICFLM
jgi:hypothetical protein